MKIGIKNMTPNASFLLGCTSSSLEKEYKSPNDVPYCMLGIGRECSVNPSSMCPSCKWPKA